MISYREGTYGTLMHNYLPNYKVYSGGEQLSFI
jgi:hypothetical protein